MADFSEDERAYLAFLEEMKATLPPEPYRSVRRLEITDTKTLLNTFFFFFSSEFHKSAQIRLAGDILSKPLDLQIKKLNPENYRDFALNFQKISEEDKRIAIQGYFTKVMKYLPGFKLTVEPNVAYLEDQTLKERTALFFEHYRKNHAQLLAGPPHKDQHTINREKAAAWVAAQKSAERKRLAGLLLENIRYIPHSELLAALESCIDRTYALLKPGPVIFITGAPKKSNYYIALLFAHFWLSKGYRIDGVMERLGIDGLSMQGNFIDIDDMSYSGSQTNSILRTTTNSFLNDYHVKMRDELKDKTTGEDNPYYNDTHMLLPRYLVEQTLNELGFQFILVRAFMSKYSFDIFSNDYITPTLPLQMVTAEVIDYMPTVDPVDKKKIESLFNDTVHTTVYFDHKVADTPSTYLFPISFGIVPKKSIVENIGWQYNSESIPRLENSKEDKDEGIEFMPFINHCEKETRPGFPTTRVAMLNNETPNSIRCPTAWYKHIDYDAGVYNPRPEPVSTPEPVPTRKQVPAVSMKKCSGAGCTIMGGRRTRRKQRSRKQRSRKQKKTRRSVRKQ